MNSLRHVLRLLGARSALTMNDLISLAKSGAQPAALPPIYEGYSARTTRAIATSYAVATAAAGGLLAHVSEKDRDMAGWDPLLVMSLAAVIALAALVGLFQHAELAQLPAELAKSSYLLATFGKLEASGVGLGTPLPREDGKRWRLRLRLRLDWLVLLLAVGAVVCSAKRAIEESDAEAAAATLACAVAFVLTRRIVAEFGSVPRAPCCDEWHKRASDPLARRIGDFQLDQYATDPKVARFVNHCIENAAHAANRPRPGPSRRCRLRRP